jgi:beta-lactamase class A
MYMSIKQLSLTCILLICLFTSKIAAQSAFPPHKPDQKLQQRLTELTRNFKGEVGIYVRHLKSGKTAAINADTIFLRPV